MCLSIWRHRFLGILIALGLSLGTLVFAQETAPILDNTGFVDVRAEGRGRLSPWPMRVPLWISQAAPIAVWPSR
jgi:hypothetical protein